MVAPTRNADIKDIVNGINSSIQGVSTTEQAIQKQIQAALAASTTMITGLVKDNAYPADMAQQDLKVHKAVIQQTIDAIDALSTLVPKTGSSDGDAQ